MVYVRRRPWLKYFVVSQTLSSNVRVCVYAINNNPAQGRRILLLWFDVGHLGPFGISGHYHYYYIIVSLWNILNNTFCFDCSGRFSYCIITPTGRCLVCLVPTGEILIKTKILKNIPDRCLFSYRAFIIIRSEKNCFFFHSDTSPQQRSVCILVVCI